MGRSLFISLFLMGLFASMISRCASLPAPHRAKQVAAEANASPSWFGSGEKSGRSGGGSVGDGSSTEIERSSDGHFYADVKINGSTVHMLVDTGATGIALSREDASSAGVATSIGMNEVVGEGADGSVHGEYVKLDQVELGGTSASGLEAIVLNSGEQSLLGQEFLARFDSVEIHGDTMVLK